MLLAPAPKACERLRVVKLKIAAKIDAADQEYFEAEIRHLLDHPLIDFIGEIGDGEKEAFLGGAVTLLMPIDWPEPFGLVAIEAMACGTPVLAFPFGSMPELIEPGVNGALADSVEQAVEAVEALAALDRALCRRSFEERFTAARMAKDYIGVYDGLVGGAASRQGRPALSTPGIPLPVTVASEEDQDLARLDHTRVRRLSPDPEAPTGPPLPQNFAGGLRSKPAAVPKR